VDILYTTMGASGPFSAFFFVALVVIGTFILLNLILAIVLGASLCAARICKDLQGFALICSRIIRWNMLSGTFVPWSITACVFYISLWILFLYFLSIPWFVVYFSHSLLVGNNPNHANYKQRQKAASCPRRFSSRRGSTSWKCSSRCTRSARPLPSGSGSRSRRCAFAKA